MQQLQIKRFIIIMVNSQVETIFRQRCRGSWCLLSSEQVADVEPLTENLKKLRSIPAQPRKETLVPGRSPIPSRAGGSRDAQTQQSDSKNHEQIAPVIATAGAGQM